MENDIVLEMKGIAKRFPGVIANEGVDFTVVKGEIHALLGENGAGKSTLMSILAGLYQPDEGNIFIHGKQVYFRSPKDASRHGVGMIHQNFKLVQPFTVSENIILGSDSTPVFLNMKKIEKQLKEFSLAYGFDMDMSAKVWQLSVGEQQRVEILKVLHRGAELLILDEPTTVLTPQEVGELFDILRKLTLRGCAVVIITHKMDEVMDVADRITVLRKGKLVGCREKVKTTPNELAKMMVGRDIHFYHQRMANVKGEVVLKLENICARNDKGLPALQNIDFSIREGEILAIAGVAGNGQKELAEVITGLRSLEQGRMLMHEKEVTGATSRQLIEKGVRYVPEDRLGTGLVGNMDLVDNLLLKDYRLKEYNRGIFLNRKKARAVAAKIVKKFTIHTGNIKYPVRMMSGGNLQKLLFAREVTGNAKLLIAAYPVRGLDIGATENVYNLLLGQRERGRGILFISEDLNAIFSIADRIAVLFEGKIMDIIPAAKANIEDVGLLMAGKVQDKAVG